MARSKASSGNETGVSLKMRTSVTAETRFVTGDISKGRKNRANALPSMPNAVPRLKRSNAWHPDYLKPLQLMLAGGATDIEIADALGIGVHMLYSWRRESEELRDMLLAYKAGFDLRIERTLAANALGYTYPAEKIFLQDGVVHRVQYTEYVKPDTVAAIFWLKNRQPDRWRDVQRHEVEDTTPAADEPSDARKVAMAMLNVIRQGMMKRGELPQPPALMKEFEHVATSGSAAEPTARAGQDRTQADPAASAQREGDSGGSVPGDGTDDADYRADRSRPAGRRRRAYSGYRDEGDGGVDID